MCVNVNQVDHVLRKLSPSLKPAWFGDSARRCCHKAAEKADGASAQADVIHVVKAGANPGVWTI